MKSQKVSRPELGKWSLWRLFAADSSIRPHLPPTRKFSMTSLKRFLESYGMVYLKPSAGYGGQGIIKVWQTEKGYSYVRVKGETHRRASFTDLYNSLKRYCFTGNGYIVQKAIDLAHVDGRPFDIRLMMMRQKGAWRYIGALAKVAGENSIVTNYLRSKGQILDIEAALQRSELFDTETVAQIMRDMIRLGYKVCRRFDKYKTYWQIGLDLGVDKRGKVWVIEENTGPAHFLFRKLPDKSIYRRIRSIARLRRKK
ncbi:YheC/YheD family protein [Heliobacillus mobilis]|uniref:YheC/YheD family protein n=1 Tax=Heliobacterium mobile TaxID=28064 RepID=A0A6I3SNP6_HELMO|nr:YheC/YheD family protein [Heliobacterium mobile]MTV50660.1 YheC/YheD family protein [Heliobacterium mobile]